MMEMTIRQDPIPLTTDAEGIVRVGETRVPLDTVVQAFDHGAGPEEIAYQYPALRLADIYGVIGYYLHNQQEVHRYLRQRKQISSSVRQENEFRFPMNNIRDRLLSRRK